MDAYKTINDTLVHLFNEIWELEEKAIITEEFKNITNNDMHIIEAIGLERKAQCRQLREHWELQRVPDNVHEQPGQ